MFIQLGLINYKLILPLVFPICLQLKILIGQSDSGSYELFINYLSYSFAGFIYLMVRYNTIKSGKEIIPTTNKQVSTAESSAEKIQIDIYGDLDSNAIIQKFKNEKLKNEKKELRKLKLFVIFLVFMNFLPASLEIIIYNSLKDSKDYDYYDLKESCSMFFVILFYVLFSIIFLKHKIYNHQIFSLVIVIICTILIFISYVIENELNSNKIKNIILFSLIFCFYALYNVLGKKLLDSFIISPYYLMFAIGFISLIFYYLMK